MLLPPVPVLPAGASCGAVSDIGGRLMSLGPHRRTLMLFPPGPAAARGGQRR